MRYARTIIGYHGCTARTAARILRGEPFSPSNNDFDWLGHGVYFWEHGPDRALRFIREKLRRENRREAPAVVGALLQLGRGTPRSRAQGLNGRVTYKLLSATRLASSESSVPYSRPMQRPKAKLDPHTEAHARFRERMRNATPAEHIESLVRAGILTKSGKFAPPYEEFESLRKVKRPKAAAR